MKKTFWIIAAFVLVGAAALAVDNGKLYKNWASINLGANGTAITSINAGTIAFAGATTGVLTVTGAASGDTYLCAIGWTSASADPGKTTYAVSTNAITVTTANATTGTCTVICVGK